MRITRELLLKFSRDECNPEEAEAVQAWFRDGHWPDPAPGDTLREEISQVAWERLKRRIPLEPGAVRRPPRRAWLPAAAAVALALLLGGGLLWWKGRGSAEDAKVYVTGPGEQRSILLPDSSFVYLSPQSTLRISPGYGHSQRTLRLSGQAFFDVSGDARRPFTVLSGSVSTTALGTAFRIVSYEEGKQINVSLSYGKVLIRDISGPGGGDHLYLNQGEEMVYDKRTHEMRVAASAPRTFDYRQDVLYFRDAGVREIAQKLSRYYHLRVDYEQVKDVRWSLSGEFDFQPLEVVMNTIAYTCNIRYQLTSDTLQLLPMGERP